MSWRLAILAGAAIAGGCGESAARPDAAGRRGEQIVARYCAACHGAGVLGAPRLGNRDDWAPKLAEGRDHLWHVVLGGENAMPPRGNCFDCSDAELRAAFEYMLSSIEPAPKRGDR